MIFCRSSEITKDGWVISLIHKYLNAGVISRVEFETPDDDFVVVFYRHGTQKLSGSAQKTAQKEEKTAQKEERLNALLEYCKEPRDRDDEVSWYKT